MLRIMREKASSWIIKILLFAIVVVFIFWGVGNFKSKKATRIATVNGEWITFDEYRNAYDNMIERYRQTFGNNLSSEMIAALNLKNQALDQLINERLMIQAANELKFRVTDEELKESIRKISIFQKDGAFSDELYTSILRRWNYDPNLFQESQRKDLLLNKLRNYVIGSVKVSEDEAIEWYNWEKSTININFSQFPVSKYTDLNPTQEDLTQYFELFKNNFKTEAQVKVRFIGFDPKDFSNNVSIAENELKDYYETNISAYKTEKTVQASHILLKTAADEKEESIEEKRKKLISILERARSGEDFAKLAKEFSDDASKENGGDLGVFKDGDMVKPFSEKAFSMKVGEISDPVRTQFGWHLIKLVKINEAITTAFEEAESDIRKKLVERNSKDYAFDKANEIYENSFEGNDLVDAAKNFGLTLESTDFFDKSGPKHPKISNPSKFASIAFNLNVMDISEVQEINGSFFIIQTTERKDPYIPELSVVADRVKSEWVKEKQWEKAKKDADQCFESLKKESDFIKAAKSVGDVAVDETGFFGRSVSIPKIGYEPGVSTEAFNLSKEKTVPDEVLKGASAYYVIQLKERKKPDAEAFDKEKKSIMDRLLRQKQEKIYENWLQSLKDKGTVIKEDIFYKEQ